MTTKLRLGFLCFAFFAISFSAHGQNCGGVGQRACCLTENTSLVTSANPLGDCQAGLTQVYGCYDGTNNNSQCSNQAQGIKSLGICVALSPCGGEGQRSCTASSGINSCNSGQNMYKGCSGNCLAGEQGVNGPDLVSWGTCSSKGPTI